MSQDQQRGGGEAPESACIVAQGLGATPQSPKGAKPCDASCLKPSWSSQQQQQQQHNPKAQAENRENRNAPQVSVKKEAAPTCKWCGTISREGTKPHNQHATWLRVLGLHPKGVEPCEASCLNPSWSSQQQQQCIPYVRRVHVYRIYAGRM